MVLAGTAAWGWVLGTAARDMPPAYPDHAKLLVVRDVAGNETPVRTAEDWAKRRAHILAHMEAVMGPLPNASKKVPLDVQVQQEIKTERWVRRRISFATEKDDRVPAYLFLPTGRTGKVPAVLCLHQTTQIGKGEPAGLGGNPNLHYALHLAERGYVTLAPDYPNFGDHPFDAYGSGYQSATMKAIWDNMRAIDLLQSMPEVDGQRIGCIGHSLGGHNTMYTAAFDPRIQVLVSNCGFNSFRKYYGGDLTGWSHKGYMPRIASLYGKDAAKMPFDFTEVVATFAPRPFLASAPLRDSNFEVSGVRDCIDAALPVYELLRAKDRLTAHYPDCAHDFPEDVRRVAYDWLDRWLKGN
jgi:dienelactone hydrolase